MTEHFDAAPKADRPPTEDEETAAEQAAEGVDIDSVSAHEQEMGKVGAEVRGEGQIEPPSSE
jgi:hypothetical protein